MSTTTSRSSTYPTKRTNQWCMYTAINFSQTILTCNQFYLELITLKSLLSYLLSLILSVPSFSESHKATTFTHFTKALISCVLYSAAVNPLSVCVCVCDSQKNPQELCWGSSPFYVIISDLNKASVPKGRTVSVWTCMGLGEASELNFQILNIRHFKDSPILKQNRKLPI